MNFNQKWNIKFQCQCGFNKVIEKNNFQVYQVERAFNGILETSFWIQWPRPLALKKNQK